MITMIAAGIVDLSLCLHEISEGRCILFRQVRIVHEAYTQTPAVTETQNPVGVQRVTLWGQDGAKMGPTSRTS